MVGIFAVNRRLRLRSALENEVIRPVVAASCLFDDVITATRSCLPPHSKTGPQHCRQPTNASGLPQRPLRDNPTFAIRFRIVPLDQAL
jgi:hypothetical protein